MEFLISFSDYSFLMYKYRIDFYILILQPATLLNLFLIIIVYVYVCVYFLGFSVYKIMSYANRDSFTSSSLSWMPFLFLA